MDHLRWVDEVRVKGKLTGGGEEEGELRNEIIENVDIKILKNHIRSSSEENDSKTRKN